MNTARAGLNLAFESHVKEGVFNSSYLQLSGLKETRPFSAQAWLFAGNSADDQLGDIWALDTAAAQWTKLSDNADQVKAWHQSHIMTTEQVSSSLSITLITVSCCHLCTSADVKCERGVEGVFLIATELDLMMVRFAGQAFVCHRRRKSNSWACKQHR